MPTCRVCGIDRPLDEMERDTRYSGGWSNRCRACNRENKRRWRERNLHHRFSVPNDWYEQTLEAQGGGCAICGAADSGAGGRRFGIDHDHSCCPGDARRTCGRCNRGLLCHPCNIALAQVERVCGWGQKAEEYLARHGR